jgi:hypothetical protein
MIMRSGPTTLMLVGALMLAGCGGGSSPSSLEIWCDGMCAAVGRCGFDDPTCTSKCAELNPGLARESTRGASAEQPCLAKNLSCQGIGGDDAAWKMDQDACWKEAQMTVEITPHVRQICAADALAWFNCGSSFSVDVCEHRYAMWADDVLDGLAPCQAMSSCDAFLACEKTVFGS